MSKQEILKTVDGKVYFRGVEFVSASDIDRQIETAEDIMSDIISKLKQIAIARPSDITPEGQSPLEYVNLKVSELMEDYDDQSQTWNTLMCAKTCIDEYARKNNISEEEAFAQCYVDRYADLKNELNSHEDNNS